MRIYRVEDEVPRAVRNAGYAEVVGGDKAIGYVVETGKKAERVEVGTQFEDMVVIAGSYIGVNGKTLRDPEANNDVYMDLESFYEEAYDHALEKLAKPMGMEIIVEETDMGYALKVRWKGKEVEIWRPDMGDEHVSKVINDLFRDKEDLVAIAAEDYFRDDIEEDAQIEAKMEMHRAEKELGVK